MIPLWELYKICETAREILRGPLRSGTRDRAAIHGPARRVHAHSRTATTTPCRRPKACCSINSHDRKVDVYSVGKIFDVFLGRGIGEYEKTKNNADGMAKTLDAHATNSTPACIFVNLVDFDQLYGHRNDVEGYARALEEFDAWLPALYQKLSERRSADPHRRPWLRSDHAVHRSQPRIRSAAGVPAAQPEAVDLGLRSTLSDIGQTVAENFGAKNRRRELSSPNLLTRVLER